MSALVAAPRGTLIAIGNQLWLFAMAGAYFWMMRTILFFVFKFRLSTVQHGAARRRWPVERRERQPSEGNLPWARLAQSRVFRMCCRHAAIGAAVARPLACSEDDDMTHIQSRPDAVFQYLSRTLRCVGGPYGRSAGHTSHTLYSHRRRCRDPDNAYRIRSQHRVISAAVAMVPVTLKVEPDGVQLTRILCLANRAFGSPPFIRGSKLGCPLALGALY